MDFIQQHLQQGQQVIQGFAQNFAHLLPQPAQNITQNFGNQMQKNPINWGNYQNQVQANKQTPFFNDTGNNPMQWAAKVYQDYQKRGPYEALQDLSYPVLMNPYVEPIEEPIVGNIRVANYQAGRPYPLLNNLLGQPDHPIPPTQ